MASTGNWGWSALEGEYQPPVDLKTDRPHSARMYDYLVGGKDHFPADRMAAEQALTSFPTLRTAALENRRFLGRAVRYLVQEEGIRQFLDIGSGLPTADNVHQVAQRYDPLSRVVYVDNDPIVLVHGRALLEENDRTTVVQSDLHTPQQIIDHPDTRQLIDFSQPLAILVVAIFHFVPDDAKVAEIMHTLVNAAPVGSFFVLSHATAEISPETALGVQEAYRDNEVPLTLRDRAEFQKFFTGLEMVEPGIQVVSDWRPDIPEKDRPSHAEVSWYGGVGKRC